MTERGPLDRLEFLNLCLLLLLGNAFRVDLFAFDPSLDGDSGKDDSCTDPLASSEFVIVHEDGEEHRKEFPR